MLTDAQMLYDLRSQIDLQIWESLSTFPRPQEGVITASSYNPQYCVAELSFGDTICNPGDDGNTYILHPALPLLSTQPGDMYGPTGGEKGIAIKLEEGYGVIYRTTDEDSPMVPAGERWILHKASASQSMSTATYDSGLKHTNDGATQGDGLGGAYYGQQGALTQVQTKSSNTVTLNDTTKAVTVQSSQGLTSLYDDSAQQITHTVQYSGTPYNPITGATSTPSIFSQLDAVNQYITQNVGPISSILDQSGILSGTPNSIQHIVPAGGIVSLGSLASELSTTDNAVTRFTDLNSTVTQQVTQLIGNSIIQFLTAVIANGGLGTSLQASSLLAVLEAHGLPTPTSFFALLPSLNGITVPGCSQTVLSK